MRSLFYTILITLMYHSVSAQINLQDYDSVFIRKPTEHKLIYEFSNRFRAISIRRIKWWPKVIKLAGESVKNLIT
jgi:hypothetical protein